MRRSVNILAILLLIGATTIFSGCITGTGDHTDTISGVEETADGDFGTCKTWKVYLDKDNGLPAKNKGETGWDGIYSLDRKNKDLREFLQNASKNKRLVTIHTEEREFTWPCEYHGKTVITNASYADK